MQAHALPIKNPPKCKAKGKLIWDSAEPYSNPIQTYIILKEEKTQTRPTISWEYVFNFHLG